MFKWDTYFPEEGDRQGEARREAKKGKIEGIRIKTNNAKFKIYIKKYLSL